MFDPSLAHSHGSINQQCKEQPLKTSSSNLPKPLLDHLAQQYPTLMKATSDLVTFEPHHRSQQGRTPVRKTPERTLELSDLTLTASQNTIDFMKQTRRTFYDKNDKMDN